MINKGTHMKKYCYVMGLMLSFFLPIKVNAIEFKVDNNFKFDYTVDSDKQTINFLVTIKTCENCWFGWGYHNFMFPADCFIGSFHNSHFNYFDGYNPGIPTLSFFPAPAPDNAPIFMTQPQNSHNNQQNYQANVLGNQDGYTTIRIKRALITNDIFDTQFKINGKYQICAAYNPNQAYYTENYNIGQPSHTKTLCGEIQL